MVDEVKFREALEQIKALPRDCDKSARGVLVRQLLAAFSSSSAVSDLAQAVGCTIQAVYRWHNGTTRTSLRNIASLERLLTDQSQCRDDRLISNEILKALATIGIPLTMDDLMGDLNWLLGLEREMGVTFDESIVSAALANRHEKQRSTDEVSQ